MRVRQVSIRSSIPGSLMMMPRLAATETAPMMAIGIASNKGHGVAMTSTARKRVASAPRIQPTAVGWILGADATRFLAVLVIATPCPLLLAIPIAIIGAVSVAASRGIIIKDPGMLERIDTCRTLIFDKTGTLTYGRL